MIPVTIASYLLVQGFKFKIDVKGFSVVEFMTWNLIVVTIILGVVEILFVFVDNFLVVIVVLVTRVTIGTFGFP